MASGADAVVQIGGPWTHRSISANGTRFHAVEAGDGPLVLLLHGFPEFWWTWRHQLAVLPEAGYRAVVAGHGLGGLIGWTLAAYYPKVIRRLAVISMGHPLRMRASVLGDPLGQGRRSGYALGAQLPIWPERQLLRDGAFKVGQLLEKWSAPGWPDPQTERTYARAMKIPSVAHSALEYHRWLARSSLRPDGLRYAKHMRTPIAAPVLHLHGALDSCVLPQTARGAGRYVDGPYRWRVIDGAGHFPHEERPEIFDTELLGWLADPEPER
jgi:pimeloyl-ACP methyl ester carboxylesterase